MNKHSQNGFSLIELMVSMTIGFVLIGGALYVYDEARATLNINEKVARMQENARWALDVLEPDIRLAGYWGRHTIANTITGRANSALPIDVDVTSDCDNNWAIDIATSLRASNNANPGLDCIADSDYLDGTDTLEIRHASGQTIDQADLQAGRIYLRTHESGAGSLFVGAAEPAIVDGQNNALMAHVYYVRPYSVGNTAPSDPATQLALQPSLRRQALALSSGAPVMLDQEVIAGIEDLQVQFGIDPNDDGSVDRYVNPDNPVMINNPKILAVRIWIRVRADRPEPGFSDTRTYAYADQDFTPTGEETAYRRLLVSRTIFLRNESIVTSGFTGAGL